jgi:hypothetical protein
MAINKLGIKEQQHYRHTAAKTFKKINQEGNKTI